MIYALIVIYNKKISDSITYNSIKNYLDKINLIIFDNSTSDYGNKLYCDDNNIKYFTKNKNVGLSKAYNYVINTLDKNKLDYLIILDDDTILNEEYILQVFENINNKIDIILPLIKSNNKLISPSQVSFGCRIKRINNIDNINLGKITAINSGMVIKTDVYKKIKYNEKLFLDYVDHEFMKNIRYDDYKIKVLNVEIYQNFSRDEKQTIEAVKYRFNIYKKDFKYYCKMCNKEWFYYINISKLKLLNALRYKKII